MRRFARFIRTLWGTMMREGPRVTAQSLASYLAWRWAGSPEERGLPPAQSPVSESIAVILLMRDWYQSATPPDRGVISVVLPTIGRRTLRRAIESVVAQSYPHWELMVVNDGPPSLDLARDILDDERVRVLESGGSGPAVARNMGLDHASGRFIAYLDDDNVMDQHWLKSIALHLEERPSAEVIIGAQVVTPESGSDQPYWIRYPSFFDWQSLIQSNYIDMAMLAHRPQSQMRFDPELPAFLDWDFVVRLTFNRRPYLIPALSGTYFTGAMSRISHRDRERTFHDLRERFRLLARDREAPGLITAEDLTAVQGSPATAIEGST